MSVSARGQNGEPQRLLIVRRSSLGDIVYTMPTLVALRRGFPQAYIAWLVDRRYREVLEGHLCLDEVIDIHRHSPGQVLALWAEARRVGHDLRRKKFDMALDVQGLLKSGVMAYLSKPFREGDLSPGIELAVTQFLKTSKLTEHVSRLKAQLETRKLVEKAKGLLMTDEGFTEAQAYRKLQKISMQKNKSMKEVAEAIILMLG